MRIFTSIIVLILAACSVFGQGTQVIRTPLTTNNMMNAPQDGWIAIWNNIAKKWSNGVNTASATNAAQPPSTVLSNLTTTGVAPGATNASAYIASASGLGTNINLKSTSGASRALMVNTNLLVVTNGNVGIGTDAPDAKLRVVGEFIVTGGDITAHTSSDFRNDAFAGDFVLVTDVGPNAAIAESAVTTQQLLDLVNAGPAKTNFVTASFGTSHHTNGVYIGTTGSAGTYYLWDNAAGAFRQAVIMGGATFIWGTNITTHQFRGTGVSPLSDDTTTLGNASQRWKGGFFKDFVRVDGELFVSSNASVSSLIVTNSQTNFADISVENGGNLRVVNDPTTEFTVYGEANITSIDPTGIFTFNVAHSLNVDTNMVIGGTNASRYVKLTGGQAGSSILRTDGNTNIVGATIGSGLSFDGTTLSATGGAGSTQMVALAVGGLTTTNATSLISTNLGTNAAVAFDMIGPAVGHYGISGNSTISLTNMVAFTNGTSYRKMELWIRQFGVAGTLTIPAIGPHQFDYGGYGLFIAENATNVVTFEWTGVHLVASVSHSYISQASSMVTSNLVGTVANNVTNENSTALQINTGTLTLTPGVLSNVVASGFGAPYIAVNTNGGALANITNLAFRTSNVILSNDSAGIASLHVTSTGGAASTNNPVQAVGTLILTNGTIYKPLDIGSTTNIVLSWNTNYYVASPSNVFTISWTDVPASTDGRQMFLKLINTNASGGFFPTNGLNGGSVILLPAASTNEYAFNYDTNGFWIRSGQILTTGSGDTNVFNISPNLHTPTNWNPTIADAGGSKVTFDFGPSFTDGDVLTAHSTGGVFTNRASAGGSQTPVLQDINYAAFSASNVFSLSLGKTNVADSGTQNPSIVINSTNSSGQWVRTRYRWTNSAEVVEFSVNGGAYTALSVLNSDGSFALGNAAVGRLTLDAAATTLALDATSPRLFAAAGNLRLESSSGVIALGSAGLSRFTTAGLEVRNNVFATNGIASFATNRIADVASFVGTTNIGTNAQIWNIRGTSGNIVYWNRTGLNGGTAAGIALWTNTVVASGSDIIVGINCGIAIDTGSGVIGGGRAF